MNFTDSLDGDIVYFKLTGKIVTHEDSMTRFHGRMHEYVNLNKKSVIIDLSKIELMTSVGLGLLISALATVRNAGGRMVLANITRIQNLIAITRLNTVFECYDSIEETLESFKKD